MPLGFGTWRQAVPGEDENDYNAPPNEAFQQLNSSNNGRYEEEYGLPNGGQFVGARKTAGQLSENQRQDLQDSKGGLTARERLSMVSNADSINAYEQSIKKKKRQNCCQRCYLLILLAIIGLVVGLFFAFGGDSAAAARGTFREAWRPPAPTPRPTRPPTIRPSAMPSVTASNEPSLVPSGMPTVTMSNEPSRPPTDVPSFDPSIQVPSYGPSAETSLNTTNASTTVNQTTASPTLLTPSTSAPTPSATIATVPITEKDPAASNETNETAVQVPVDGSQESTSDTHKEEDHGDGDEVTGDNIFRVTSCPGGTEMMTLYMYDQVGDGWGDARISITEMSQTINEPIFKGGINGFESESIRNICLKTNVCYSIVVEGGMWMEEIRWGIGHVTEQELPQAIFRSRNSQSTKATWLAPADCMFSLYGACDNVCSEGYGENPPPLDESGNVIEKEVAQAEDGVDSNQGDNPSTAGAEGPSQPIASDSSVPAQQPTAIASNPPPAPTSETPTAGPPVTASPVQAPSVGAQQTVTAPVAPAPTPASAATPVTVSPTTKAPVATVPVPTAPTPTAPSPTNPPPVAPGMTYSAASKNDEASMSWSYYSYSYSVSYSYRRKERRERERGRRRAKRLGGGGMTGNK